MRKACVLRKRSPLEPGGAGCAAGSGEITAGLASNSVVTGGIAIARDASSNEGSDDSIGVGFSHADMFMPHEACMTAPALSDEPQQQERVACRAQAEAAPAEAERARTHAASRNARCLAKRRVRRCPCGDMEEIYPFDLSEVKWRIHMKSRRTDRSLTIFLRQFHGIRCSGPHVQQAPR